MPFKQLPEEQDESRAMWLFHKVFGHGSSDNPGGSGRMETGGWILVVASVFYPIWETVKGSAYMGETWRGAPIVFVLGVFIVRASKKRAVPPEETDTSPDMNP